MVFSIPVHSHPAASRPQVARETKSRPARFAAALPLAGDDGRGVSFHPASSVTPCPSRPLLKPPASCPNMAPEVSFFHQTVRRTS